MIKPNATNGKKDTNTAFFTIGNFDLFNSNSSDPSNTINIKPIVPNNGSKEERSGTEISKKVVSCFNIQPNSSNKITDGILVFDELISNK